jgi:hypothetical protein
MNTELPSRGVRLADDRLEFFEGEAELAAIFSLASVRFLRKRGGAGETAINKNLDRADPQELVAITGLLAKRGHLIGTFPVHLDRRSWQRAAMQAVYIRPFGIRLYRTGGMGKTGNAETELLLKNANQVVAHVLVRWLRDQSRDDVLTLAYDTVQFSIFAALDDTALRLRGGRRYLRQPERHAVRHRTVATCSRQQYRIVWRCFIEIAS